MTDIIITTAATAVAQDIIRMWAAALKEARHHGAHTTPRQSAWKTGCLAPGPWRTPLAPMTWP